MVSVTFLMLYSESKDVYDIRQARRVERPPVWRADARHHTRPSNSE
jgi:hypothetical protein